MDIAGIVTRPDHIPHWIANWELELPELVWVPRHRLSVSAPWLFVLLCHTTLVPLRDLFLRTFNDDT